MPQATPVQCYGNTHPQSWIILMAKVQPQLMLSVLSKIWRCSHQHKTTKLRMSCLPPHRQTSPSTFNTKKATEYGQRWNHPGVPTYWFGPCLLTICSQEVKGPIETVQSKLDEFEKRFNNFQDVWRKQDERWRKQDERWQEQDERWQGENKRRQEIVWGWETSERVAKGAISLIVSDG